MHRYSIPRHAARALKNTFTRVIWHGIRYAILCRRDRQRLRELKNAYLGESIILVCNGPSLNSVDFDQLGDYKKFFINKGYLLRKKYPELKIDFLYAGDSLLIKDMPVRLQEEENIDIMFSFFPCGNRFYDNRRKILIKKVFTGECFIDSPEFGITAKGSTTVSLALIHYMGFRRVGIVGLDHSWKTFSTADETKIFDQEDVDHFDKDYNRKGVLVQGPSPLLVEHALSQALQFFKKSGGCIMNLTESSKCRVLPFLSISEFTQKNKK